MAMRTVALIAAALAIALGGAQVIGCAQVDVPTDTGLEGIRVSGTGKVTADPDIARVQLGVETFDEEVGPALAENNAKASQIIDAVKKAGVDDKDVGTSGFTVSTVTLLAVLVDSVFVLAA